MPGGRAACNRYGGTIRIDGRSMALGEVSATDMGCQPQVMASEKAYVSALGLVDTVSREDAALVLSGAETLLRFAPLPPVPEAALLDTVWLLETTTDGAASAPVRGEPATLDFRADGTLSGSTGCRKLGGTYLVEETRSWRQSWQQKGAAPATSLPRTPMW